MSETRKPVIGIICDAFPRDSNSDRLFHAVAEEYIRAIQLGTSCTPLLIPVALNNQPDSETLCRLLDGILLTGSRSNVHPDRYAGPASKPDTAHDLKRDSSAFALIHRAMEKKIPLFGICRGFQEINVALGGTLHQQLTDIAGKLDHAERMGLAQDQQYQSAHGITLTQGGYLHRLLAAQRISINSLHHQGIDQLAQPLTQEGVADDGTVEAFRLPSDEQFLMAVQWHPEWYIADDPVSQALFSAFDQAVHDYARHK